jgi:hypothetical protein
MPREIGSREIGVIVHGLAGALGDVVSAAGERTLGTLAYVLGVEIEDLDPPQRDWWRRFEIASTSNPVVEHPSLMSFLTTESPRGLTRSGGSPVRTLELLVAILDEAEDKELAGRIRRHLRKHGITKDSVEVAAAKPAGAGAGRPRKSDAHHFLKKGQSSERLAARLARDHRDLAAEVEAGRMTIRAAREGGILKDLDPGKQLLLLVGPCLRRAACLVRDLPHGLAHETGRAIMIAGHDEMGPRGRV